MIARELARQSDERVARVAMAAACCALTGAVAAARQETAPLVAGAAVLVVLCADWRRGVWVLLSVLPFAGVPAFVGGTPGLALRDAAVILPVYAAFVVVSARRGEPIALPPLGAALPALAAFALLAALNVARAPTAGVGVLGLRVWLAYVPLLVVGYHFVRDAGDVDRALRLTALLGLAPAALAVGEWVEAARTGGFGVFSWVYGASGVEPFGFVFGTREQSVTITRVPSTFTSASSYYGFSIVAYSAALAMLLRHGGRGWAACILALAAGAVASGNRAAYVMVPAITIVALCLAGPRRAHIVAALAVGVAMALASAAGGADPVVVARLLPGHVQVTLAHGWHELTASLSASGHGTGWDTNAALRYGGTEQRRYVENWFAKASLELGIAGLASITAALAALLWHTLRPLARLDRATRQLAAPVCALLALTAASLFKGPFIDFDPLNVYFWLLAGMLAGLYRTATPRTDPDIAQGGDDGHEPT